MVHHNCQKSPNDESSKNQIHTGLDILRGKVRNNFNAGVFEPSISKTKSLK
jgi:hypothetical protein